MEKRFKTCKIPRQSSGRYGFTENAVLHTSCLQLIFTSPKRCFSSLRVKRSQTENSGVAFMCRSWSNCCPCKIFLGYPAWFRNEGDQSHYKNWGFLPEEVETPCACGRGFRFPLSGDSQEGSRLYTWIALTLPGTVITFGQSVSASFIFISQSTFPQFTMVLFTEVKAVHTQLVKNPGSLPFFLKSNKNSSQYFDIREFIALGKSVK